MTLSRNELQEKAMMAIYSALTFESIDYNYDLKEILSDITEIPYQDLDSFIKEVTVKALLNKEDIIVVLQSKMSEKWTFNRLNRLEQAILLLSYAHYFYIQDVEKAVVIDIAIHLAKKYLEDDDYKFVNGLLDNVL